MHELSIMHEKLIRNIQIRAAGAMNQPIERKNTSRLPESKKTRILTKTNQISIADPLKQRTNDLTAAKSILEKARTPNMQRQNNLHINCPAMARSEKHCVNTYPSKTTPFRREFISPFQDFQVGTPEQPPPPSGHLGR